MSLLELGYAPCLHSSATATPPLCALLARTSQPASCLPALLGLVPALPCLYPDHWLKFVSLPWFPAMGTW